MWRSFRSASTIVLILAAPLASQVSSVSDPARGPVVAGNVRVWAPGIARFRIAGTVDRATPDTLVVRGVTRARKDTIWTIPAAAITRLQIANGTHGNALTGLGLGLLAGGAAGAGIGALACGNDSFFGSGGCAVLLGIFGAGVGSVVGLVAGALTHSVRWVEAPPHPLRVSFDPRNRGRELRVAVSFGF